MIDSEKLNKNRKPLRQWETSLASSTSHMDEPIWTTCTNLKWSEVIWNSGIYHWIQFFSLNGRKEGTNLSSLFFFTAETEDYGLEGSGKLENTIYLRNKIDITVWTGGSCLSTRTRQNRMKTITVHTYKCIDIDNKAVIVKHERNMKRNFYWRRVNLSILSWVGNNTNLFFHQLHTSGNTIECLIENERLRVGE